MFVLCVLVAYIKLKTTLKGSMFLSKVITENAIETKMTIHKIDRGPVNVRTSIFSDVGVRKEILAELEPSNPIT